MLGIELAAGVFSRRGTLEMPLHSALHMHLASVAPPTSSARWRNTRVISGNRNAMREPPKCSRSSNRLSRSMNRPVRFPQAFGSASQDVCAESDTLKKPDPIAVPWVGRVERVLPEFLTKMRVIRFVCKRTQVEREAPSQRGRTISLSSGFGKVQAGEEKIERRPRVFLRDLNKTVRFDLRRCDEARKHGRNEFRRGQLVREAPSGGGGRAPPNRRIRSMLPEQRGDVRNGRSSGSCHWRTMEVCTDKATKSRRKGS